MLDGKRHQFSNLSSKLVTPRKNSEEPAEYLQNKHTIEHDEARKISQKILRSNTTNPGDEGRSSVMAGRREPSGQRDDQRRRLLVFIGGAKDKDPNGKVAERRIMK